MTFSAQVWGFSRIYPLLDGLLQDISATQVAPMALNPNSPNGTSVDAVQQSLQLQLQYSQMAGVQNASAAQAATASSTYQSNLAQQQTALLQQLVNAYSQVTAAQNNLNMLNASGTASASDTATATQALQGANANLTAAGNTITNFKNLATPAVPSAPAALASTPTLPSLSSSVLPSGVGTAATTSPAGGTPSFPPTKQLDNQINILWDRLARLVGAMSRPDNMSPDDKIYLVRFDTGIYPVERNKQLLDVNYKLSCGGVIDLFPRNAALNIVEDKYKDSAFGFGAVLNWFGVGGSVAYNREHLKASQLLGQSSYISGHGIGQQEFGWIFGIALGDDSISPGPRNTFALIWTPQDCASPNIKVISEDWVKPPKFKLEFPTLDLSSPPQWMLTSPSATDRSITSIEFNRNEFDPTSGKPAPVTVRITLSRDMDQQQTVSVDGQLIQRVRDNFGRAISPTITGSNGVLETAQMGTNTWIPTSPTTMLITLDSSQFGNQFPQILLSSPQGVIDIVHNQANNAKVLVSGNTLACGKSPCPVPSIGVLKSTTKNLGVARWIATSDSGKKRIDKICITVLDPEPGTTPVTGTGGVPTVQVISDVDKQVWGSDTEVNDISSDNVIHRLSCDPPVGSRLVCDAPDPNSDGTGNRPSIELQIIDQRHVGNTSIKGIVFTKECTNDPFSDESCRKPLIWKTNPPKLMENNTPNVSNSRWKMWVQVVNVESTDTATLGGLEADKVGGNSFDCSQGMTEPCTATFAIPIDRINIVSDWMDFHVRDNKGRELGGRATITNVLENIKPIITQIADDRTSWFGQNLVFNTIQVGNSKTFKVDCMPDGSQCRGDGKYGTTAGFLYFIANPGLALPFNQVNTTGTNTAIVYTPPKPPAAQEAEKPAPAPNSANKLDLKISPELKEKFSMEAVQ